MQNIPVEGRLAINDLLISYCTAANSLGDMEALLEVFTDDAVFDLSGIGLPKTTGHAGIRSFFTGVFENMTHHAHYLTNSAMTAFEGDTASARAYIMGLGRARDGNEVTVYGRYFLNVQRTANGWKTT